MDADTRKADCVKPFNLFKQEQESVKSKANKTEKTLAKKLGGRRQPCSGALAGAKGDVKTAKFLFDSKETVNESISVKASDLMKIRSEADKQSRDPALVLSLCSGVHQWVCIPLSVFKERMR